MGRRLAKAIFTLAGALVGLMLLVRAVPEIHRVTGELPTDGRVDVFVERLGVVVWSGWGLARWWGKRRGHTLWFDPPYVGWPPQRLVPGDALEVEAPCDELLLALAGTGLRGWLVVQLICEDKRRRRYCGDPELSCIGPQCAPFIQIASKRPIGGSQIYRCD